MSVRFSITPLVARSVAALQRIQWRDPLVQTWGLLGGLIVMGIGAHYVSLRGSGEKKNQSLVEALICQDRGASVDGAFRPVISMAPGGSMSSAPDTTAPCDPDLRACADDAAKRPGWKYLPLALRKETAALRTSGASASQPPRISVTWSGTPAGNAAAFELYHADTLGERRGAPHDFIIGNGRRGQDGLIETTRHWTLTAASGKAEISICLVGDTQKPTPAQDAALGELITAIEASTGTATLAMRQPQVPALLAGY